MKRLRLTSIPMLILTATAIQAGPPDRPPCQDSDSHSYPDQFVGFSKGEGPVDGSPKCSVVKSCTSDTVHLMSVSGPQGIYSFEGMVNVDPRLPTDPPILVDHDTELMRMRADANHGNFVLMPDLPVITVRRHHKSGAYSFLFMAADPNKPIFSNDDSHLSTMGSVTLNTSKDFHFFYLSINNSKRMLSVTTWDENDQEVVLEMPFHWGPNRHYDNVTVTANSASNQCGESPKPFDFELNHEALNGVSVIE